MIHTAEKEDAVAIAEFSETRVGKQPAGKNFAERKSPMVNIALTRVMRVNNHMALLTKTVEEAKATLKANEDASTDEAKESWIALATQLDEALEAAKVEYTEVTTAASIDNVQKAKTNEELDTLKDAIKTRRRSS